MTDISSGLSAGLSRLLGKVDVPGEDLSGFADLLDSNNLSSIKNNSDAGDLDLEEVIELLFATHEAWWDKNDGNHTEEQAELAKVKSALLEAVGLSNEDFNAIYQDSEDLDTNGRKTAFLNVAGSVLGLGTDYGAISDRLNEKLTTSEEANSGAFSSTDTNSLQGEKAKLREIANNPNQLSTHFNGSTEEDLELLLTSMASDLADGTHESFSKEDFQAIFDAAVGSLPEGDRESFLEGIFDLVNEKDGSDFVIDASAGDEIIVAAFGYADQNKDIISHDVRTDLYNAQKDISGSDVAEESDDLNIFLMDHFGVYDEEEIFDSDGNLKSSQRTDIDGLVQAMIADDVTDSGSIIELMGKLPSGDTRAQGEFSKALLSHLPSEALDDVMPFLIGHVLVLEQKGDIDEEGINSIFEEVASSGNDAQVLEYMQEMGLEIDSLKDGEVSEEMLANDSFREAIMDEWADLMRDESSEESNLIDKQVSLVTGNEFEGEDDEESSEGSSKDTDEANNDSTASSPAEPFDFGKFMQGQGMGGMGFGMPMGMMGMGMMNPMSAYTQGYTDGVTQSLMSGISGPGAFMGGGINIMGNNNTVNVNVSGVPLPTTPTPTPTPTPTSTSTTSEDSAPAAESEDSA